MKQAILKFIEENNLSPFNQSKTQLKNFKSIYKTTDAKKIHTKILSKISQNFVFPDTSNILSIFTFTNSKEEILKRQEFFKKISEYENLNNSFLKDIKKPKNWWKPEYDVVVVTEDPNTFNELKKMNCPVQLIISETDVSLLESKDIVQIINCPEYGLALESLPQGVFFKNIEEVYLERYLEDFSGWIEIIKKLNENKTIKQIIEIIGDLLPLSELIKKEDKEEITSDSIEEKVYKANEIIQEKIKDLTLSGTSLVEILSRGILPEEIKNIIEKTITELKIPREVLNITLPVTIDNEELEKQINEQSKTKYSNSAEKVKDFSDKLKNIPKRLKQLETLLLFYDFLSGIKKFITKEMSSPEISNELKIENSTNLLIENPKPISFELNDEYKCSILTGANSGGKTTLIEHILQLNSLTQIGLPTTGKIKMPLFEEIYYFAKNKGSISKGAFETLLNQMSKVIPGNKTLILADEIESVTEPGVAGNIIAATAKYFIEKNCFLVVATHLGSEIQKIKPENTRIDGIEAKGLTKNFELIVDHNPVLGRLANSTPELIVEKMANTENKEYFLYINNFLKINNKV